MRIAMMLLSLSLACGQDRITAVGGAGGDSSAPPAPIVHCEELAPDAAAPLHQFVNDEFVGSCLRAAADGTGTLAFTREILYPGGGWGTGLDFVESAGSWVVPSSASRESIDLFQQTSGFATVRANELGPAGLQVSRWDSAAALVGDTHRISTSGQSAVVAADPRGGVLAAGLLGAAAGEALSNSVVLFSTNDAPLIAWGPRPLDSNSAVLAAGVDVKGRSAVLTDGTTRFGTDHVSAQWFDQGGTPLTGEFDLLALPAGAGTSLELWPLIGGGLALAQMSSSASAPAFSNRTALVVALLNAGETRARPVPAWMTARPNARLQLTRGGRAYAVLPLGAVDVPCTQSLEVVAPDGTSCGARDYPIAAGTCTTRDLALGADGTVIQSLPDSLETRAGSSAGTVQTCTWRWWSGALK